MTEPQSPELQAALAVRAHAEAAKLTAESAKLAAETAVAQAAADKAAAELAEYRRGLAERGHDDDRNHVYRFNDTVLGSSTTTCIKSLRRWDREDPGCDLTIVFNSPGGSVIDGMALFDEIASLSKRGGGRHKVTTMVRGYAASMAGILLQAGDVRVGGRESYVLIHEISSITGGKIGEIKDEVKFYEQVCARVVDIFVTRAKGKISKATFVRHWKRQDWWLDSAGALRYGFIDRIG